MSASMPAPGFAEFATEARPRLLVHALWLCHDRHLAEDLVQTTFANMLGVWDRLDPATRRSAYAHRVLDNAFCTHLRQRRRAEQLTRSLPDRPPLPDPATAITVRASLRALGPTDRAVIVLRFLEDRSLAETAYATGLSVSAVKSRSRRALRALRRVVEADLSA